MIAQTDNLGHVLIIPITDDQALSLFFYPINRLSNCFHNFEMFKMAIDQKAFEQKVLAGGTDEQLLAWVVANSKPHSHEEIAQFSQGLLASGPKDDMTRSRFQGRLDEIAKKRGVSVGALPKISTWADVIELDEGRL